MKTPLLLRLLLLALSIEILYLGEDVVRMFGEFTLIYLGVRMAFSIILFFFTGEIRDEKGKYLL